MGFIEDYFIDPIVKQTGYNAINTIVYAVILIASLFLVLRILKKTNVTLDTKLWYDLLPWVVLGGVLRALEDINFFASLGSLHFLFVTPLIYILLFVLVIACLMLSKATGKDITKDAGIVLLSLALVAVILNGRNWLALTGTLLGSLAVFITVFMLVDHYKPKFLGFKNYQCLYAHVLDATATFVAVGYLTTQSGRFVEQHVLPSFLIDNIGAWVFIPIKIALVLLVLYYVDKDASKEWNWMIKFT